MSHPEVQRRMRAALNRIPARAMRNMRHKQVGIPKYQKKTRSRSKRGLFADFFGGGSTPSRSSSRTDPHLHTSDIPIRNTQPPKHPLGALAAALNRPVTLPKPIADFFSHNSAGLGGAVGAAIGGPGGAAIGAGIPGALTTVRPDIVHFLDAVEHWRHADDQHHHKIWRPNDPDGRPLSNEARREILLRRASSLGRRYRRRKRGRKLSYYELRRLGLVG